MKDKEIEILAERIIKGEATPDEKRTFDNWYDAKNDKVVILPASSDEEKEETRLRIYSKVRANISADRQTTEREITANPSKSLYLKIAASVVFILSMSYLLYQVNVSQSEENTPVALIEKSTKAGERSQFRLPDGTLVHLNAGSSLVFPKAFGSNQRAVELKGEAFFDVKRDEKRPFTIASGTLTTTVLGTSFNIKAYPGETKEEVWVLTGKIKVQPQRDKHSRSAEQVLIPNQGVVFDRTTRQITKKELDVRDAVAWREGWLIFESEKLEDVLRELERWYGVEFEIQDTSVLQTHVTLKQQNETLLAVMEVLKYLTGLEYTIQNKKVILH